MKDRNTTRRPTTHRPATRRPQEEEISEFIHDWASRNGDPTADDADLIFRFVADGIAIATAEELG